MTQVSLRAHGKPRHPSGTVRPPLATVVCVPQRPPIRFGALRCAATAARLAVGSLKTGIAGRATYLPAHERQPVITMTGAWSTPLGSGTATRPPASVRISPARLVNAASAFDDVAIGYVAGAWPCSGDGRGQSALASRIARSACQLSGEFGEDCVRQVLEHERQLCRGFDREWESGDDHERRRSGDAGRQVLRQSACFAPQSGQNADRAFNEAPHDSQ